MNSLLEYLVKNIVDKPQAVEVSTQGENLMLKVDPTDMGKVIGKGGRIIKAIRDLVRIRAAKSGRQTSVVLVEA